MSKKEYTPLPDKSQNYGHKIVEKFAVEEVTRTSSHHSEKHDETFYGERSTPQEDLSVTYPAVEAESEKTGEVLTQDELEQRINDAGGGEFERTDFDKGRVIINGETFIVSYDTSDAPEM